MEEQKKMKLKKKKIDNRFQHLVNHDGHITAKKKQEEEGQRRRKEGRKEGNWF